MNGPYNKQNGNFGVKLTQINWNSTKRNIRIEAPFHYISQEVENMNKKDVKGFRKILGITVSEKNCPNPIMDFKYGNFPDFIKAGLLKSGYVKPTPIQSQGWPIVFQGRNLIGVAETGSGKTLAFIIPAILHVVHEKKKNPNVRGPQVVVLSPTRELAQQIAGVAKIFGREAGVGSVCCSGGAPRGYQVNALKGASIVVGTPGRIIDFLENYILDMKHTTMFVVDEADRMLDMGFEKQLRKIHSQIPPERQTLFFTATWPRGVESLANDFLVNPVKINIGSAEIFAVHSVQQKVKVLDRRDKFDLLCDLILPQQLENNGKVLIFVATKKISESIFYRLKSQFPAAELLHGGKLQAERDMVIDRFICGKCAIVVATDVAQRGLDIPNISCVVNYDFPKNIEDYVHRIGRTGRAGKSGISWTFFSRDDAPLAKALIGILAEAEQEVPEELLELAELGVEAEISRSFPKPWNERTEEEKEDFQSLPIAMESLSLDLDQEENNEYSSHGRKQASEERADGHYDTRGHQDPRDGYDRSCRDERDRGRYQDDGERDRGRRQDDGERDRGPRRATRKSEDESDFDDNRRRKGSMDETKARRRDRLKRTTCAKQRDSSSGVSSLEDSSSSESGFSESSKVREILKLKDQLKKLKRKSKK